MYGIASTHAHTSDRSHRIGLPHNFVCRNLCRRSSALLAIGRYQLVRTVGRGGQGVVYEAFDPLHERGPGC
ncbi:MAG TPA: hypothetical protein VK509_12260 [Polyangiales bacterium]|nr:hypothetical protein [Polyangiales bacterium]